MDLHEAQSTLVRLFNDANAQFHKMPGSAIILRYIKSSYQNDPVRSAIELFLFLFAVRYMLSPSYSTQNKVKLTEEVCLLRWGASRWKGVVLTDCVAQEIDELVDDWTPEPLVAAPTQFEELETEKRPIIVG